MTNVMKRRFGSGMEKLEDRYALAGDLTVSVVSGDLSIIESTGAGNVGASNGVDVYIDPTDSSKLVVEGVLAVGGNTTINGSSAVVKYARNSINSISIDTKGGGDVVTVEGSFNDPIELLYAAGKSNSGNLGVYTRDGNDNVILSYITADKLVTVFTGKDTDNVFANFLIAHGTDVTRTGGNPGIAAAMYFDLGEQNDSILVENCSVDNSIGVFLGTNGVDEILFDNNSTTGSNKTAYLWGGDTNDSDKLSQLSGNTGFVNYDHPSIELGDFVN